MSSRRSPSSSSLYIYEAWPSLRLGGFKYAVHIRPSEMDGRMAPNPVRTPRASLFALAIGLLTVALALCAAQPALASSAQDGVPVSDAGADVTIVVGESVVFSGTGSNDDVGITNYTWNFTYEDEMQYLYGPTPEFEFWAVGAYNVTLTVTDADGHTAVDTMLVTVEKNFLMKYWPFLLLAALILVAVFQASRALRKKEFVSPKSVARYGVMTALVAAVTMATFVPFAPTKGYFNLGDSIVFFSALTFTWRVGGICGGFGSAAADILLGSGYFAPLTLVAKGAEGAVCGALSRIRGGSRYAIVLGIVVGGACMVMTYFLGELLLLNVGLGAALAEAAGNTLQVIVGGTIGVLLSRSVKKAYPQVAAE